MSYVFTWTKIEAFTIAKQCSTFVEMECSTILGTRLRKPCTFVRITRFGVYLDKNRNSYSNQKIQMNKCGPRRNVVIL